MMGTRKLPLVCISLLMAVVSCETHHFEGEECLRKYSDKELDLFYQEGFYNQKKVRKWRKDIRISAEGQATKADIANIDSLILEFRPLIIPIEIERVEEYANIKFNFVKVFHGRYGQALRRPKGWLSEEILECELLINPIFSELQRRNTMRHEFMHALGMEHPSYNYKESTILGSRFHKSLDEAEAYGTTYHKIGGLDQALVRILYDECIPLGLTKAEFEREIMSRE